MLTQHSKGKIKARILLRSIVLSIFSMVFLIYRFLYKELEISCIFDAWHEFTYPLNARMKNQLTADVVIGIGQVIMDSWIVIICLFWLVKLKHTRIAFSAALFFLMRTIMMYLVAFPFPQTLVWHSPGFFSLTVPYDRTRDFFYSGHTGSLTVIMLQFLKVRSKWVTLLVLACLIYMINMLTITRVHYTIDIIGGLIFAFFSHSVVTKFIYYLDWLVSLPYFVGKKLLEYYKDKNRLGQNQSQDFLIKDEIQKS